MHFYEQEVDRVSPSIPLYEDTAEHILCHYTNVHQKTPYQYNMISFFFSFINGNYNIKNSIILNFKSAETRQSKEFEDPKQTENATLSKILLGSRQTKKGHHIG